MRVVVRPAEVNDKDFVFSTWLKGNYWGSKYFGAMPQHQYFLQYAKNIQRLLDLPGTKVDVAVSEEDPVLVLGYSVYNNQALYWCYVKKDYRKKGICNELLKNMDFVSYVGHTPIGADIAKNKELYFDPFQEN